MRRGLTKVSLAKQSAISRERLHRFITGEVEPTEGEIVSLSEVLRFPVSFFYRGDLAKLGSASFRALSTMSAAEKASAFSVAGIAWELNKWIDAKYHLPEPDIPDLSMYKPTVAATVLRQYWGIGERPVGNMVRLLEAKGVRVFSLIERTRNVDAFSLWADDVPMVFLNTIKTPEHSRTDAAHELGHLVLRHHHRKQVGQPFEREAQTFAGVFLVPEKSALANVGRLRAPTVSTLASKKKIWKVSVSLLAHRLHTLGLITDYYYRGICIELNKHGRSWEPEGIERETSQVLESVFGDLNKSGVKNADVARDLCVGTDEVEGLIFGLRNVTAISGKHRPDSRESKELRDQIRPL